MILPRDQRNEARWQTRRLPLSLCLCYSTPDAVGRPRAHPCAHPRERASQSSPLAHLAHQEVTVRERLDLAVFYLLGGLGFLVLAAIVYFTSPQRDPITLLTAAGMLVAGLLAITAFFGTRRGRTRPPRG